ncbi:PREDICTED: ubiquitin carboxyl-terminal hydrolase 25-like isoform X2 [Populus euphratica]|uniref:Ubiquitin carboxyl-terminal hydrolase n=1 Tax=Populus euphratica TaxID=75702 RepID=A0AAJ6UHP2_POPEU|nr:PREDICTED: ubiquitin carboxyl-terminal hydrolase 25-like isoform X2 [Populus euphratica]
MGGFQLQKLQMSWQPSLLSQKRKNGPPLGLKNLGNSCYLNSVLQCLTYTPPLANFCLRLQHSSLCDSVANGDRKRDCPFCILEKRIVRSLSLDLTLDAPAKIQSCLKIFSEHFRCGRQEDAHEFLRYVIDACHNTCLRLKKLRRKGIENGGGGVSVVKEIFGGALQSQVKCLCCNYESNKVDEIMDISLDVLNSYSVRDAMQKFFQPEVLDGNNKYKCEKCQKLVAARKQMSILQAPNVLVIQLKRFEGIFGAKIDKAIAFEEVLVLSSFMNKTSQDPQPEYNLFGTIVHSGYSPESGHYYAYIKDAMGRWYCCNDSYVTLSTLQEVLSEKVYVLFFSRTNQRPASAASSFASYGAKSRDSNGCVEFKSSKGAVPLKALPTKPHVEQSSKKDISAMSRIDRVPSSPLVKSSICGNSGSKSTPLSVNGKVDHLKGQNKEMNGDVKETVLVEKRDKDVSTVTNSSNGFEKHKNVDAVEGENCHAFAAASENGHSQNAAFNSVKPLVCDSNGTTSKVTTGRVHDHLELQNGSMKCCADISGLKRKLKEDTSILLAQDAQSLAKIEEFKAALKQQASLILGSCGLFDEVYDFMRARKRLCVHEAGNKPSGTELKKLLIADAKRTFISQIPESLKEDLVKRLQSFSQEKRHSSAVLGNSTVS